MEIERFISTTVTNLKLNKFETLASCQRLSKQTSSNMGQTLGRAPLPKGSKRFLNLPKKCIYELWEAFNDIAEGFGLTIEEFQEIIKSGLMEYLNITERMLNLDTEAAFRLFDDDNNNLVDSLEFLSSFALLSGMTPEEKIRYIFAMYDFDESGVLSVDEMVLAFRSTLSGLSKLSKIDPPTETDIETIVVLGFDSIRKNNKATDTGLDYKGIDREDFVQYCLNTPEILSWIEFFDDLEEYQASLDARVPISYPPPKHTDRSSQDEAAMNLTLGGYKLLEYERRGDILLRKNWQNVLSFLAPTRKVEAKNRLPDKNVRLEWVYGFNGHSARQCLYYSAKGEAVYAAGATCVVQNIAQHSQNYFIEHSDLVTCIKLYHTEEGGTVVASGECGTRPAIHVWDCETRRLLSTFQGFHRNGILQLDFSPDREKLVSLGMDPYHSLAVHSLLTKTRIWSARSTDLAVHDVRFLTRDTLATCGVDHVFFWKESKPAGVFKRYRGHFGTAVKPETLWCVGVVGKTVFTGSETGMVYVWEGRNLISSIKGHTGAIWACHVVSGAEEQGLVTACTMGKVLIWNSKMELGATFNAAALGAIETPISSVCYDLLSSKIMIGFNSCEVFEMDATDGRNIHNGGSVIAGHFHPRVCGIGTHPNQTRFFATVGDDRSVRIFDSILRKQLRVSLMDSKGHCVAYSKDGLVLIVGIGSGIEGQEERKEGAFVALSEEDLTLLHEARDSKSLIADCKFAPNGESFALASHDGSLYLYNAKKYSGQAKCRGHGGRVERVDYSANSAYLMSNCSAGDLLFWDSTTGELQQPKSVKTTQWETNSCPASYATQGIWNFHVDDGTRYNAACKSNAQDIVAAVDNFGRLRVGVFPCTEDNACLLNCYGHAKNIENVVISCDDQRLFTTGGTDGSIFQWRVTANEVQNLSELKKDEGVHEAIPAEMKFEGRMLEHSANYENVINSRPAAICDLEEGKVDVSAMMPWHKTIVGPSRIPVEDNSEPSDTLELSFVYGFAMDISRQAMMYAPNGQLVFFAAGVAVVMNQKMRTQRFYNQHNATITAMAVNRVDSVVATGDQGEVPSIRIWNCETLETSTVLEGFHRRAICHLKFSVDGKLLVTVGHDSNHRIAIYDWKNKQIVSSSVSFDMKSLFIDFNPNGSGLIQCGNEIIRFWEFDGRNMFFQDAILGSRAKQQGFLCAGWIGSSAVVGTTDGNLYRFLGNKLDSIVQAHAGAISSIAYTADGLCSAGADGFIKVWTRFLECRLVVELTRLRTVSSVVRCIDWDYDVGRILFGTASAEIFEIGAGDGENLHKGALLEGHGGDELWGLAVNPVKDEFATCGDDAFLRVWNVQTHTTEMTVTLEMPARCCCFSPDGKQLAIGFGCPKKLSNRQFDGKWVVLDTEDYQVSHEARDSNKWITDIKYSPNGELIAMGSHDNKIYVYSVSAGYALNACISQHQSFIYSVDFSDDSQWLQSNCGGFELCFFEADTGLFIPAASRLRDTVWATHNCTMAWATQGIWPPQKDGTEMVSCDINLFRGEDGTVVAAGDNYGRIRLFRYPVTSAFACSKVYWTSSNPVTRIRFMSGDSTMITINGADKAIMQWSHRRDRDTGVAFDVLDRRSKLEEEDDDVMTLFGLSSAQEVVADPHDMSHLVSTRPWLSSIVPPTAAAELLAGKPLREGLEMSHILGLQCDLTRLSVRFNTFGDVIYPASKYACIYNKKTNSQLYYSGHHTEMSCVAVSQCGMFCASAERSDRPCIHVWDATTGGAIVVLPYLHRKGVISMQFSSDNRWMVSVGQDDDHSLALWSSPSGQWVDARLHAWTKGDVNPVLFACFYEESLSSGGANSYFLASGGRYHQKFWRLDGHCINANYAEYDKKIKIGTLLCGAKVGARFVSGSTTGHLYVWTGRKLDRSIRAHELGVTCLWSCKLGVVSSAKDGIIKMWTLEFEHIRSFSLRESDVPPVLSSVRSLDCYLSPDRDFINLILVTTAGGEVYEIAAKSGSICLLHEAHYGGQLWGLCVHPTDPDVFATTGDDRTIRVWSISTRRLLRKAVIDCSARSINWSPNGKLLIVGMGGLDGGKRQRKDGAYLLLEAETMRPIYEGRDSRHWISDVKFSPDGKSFAVASMDHKIYVYNADTYRLRGTCDRHNSNVMEFDYSADSTYIQSDAADYEHLYFEAQDGEYFSAGSQLKDIKWHDWTCLYGWPVQGLWPYFADIEAKTAFEPTAAHRSPSQDLLVAGDTSGAVKLYKYPCVNKESNFFKAQAHVKEVSKVRFMCDGRHVISLGKQDRSVIIWKVLPMKADLAKDGHK